MEAAARPEHYSEEIPLQHITPAQYLAAAQRAALHLRWLTAALDAHTVICRTPTLDYTTGEIITIAASGKTAIINCKSANEYYWDESAGRANIELFKKVIAKVIEEQEKADRNMLPVNREKYGALVPSKSYLVTPLIVYSIALVYIAMVLAGLSPLHPTAQSLFEWGGNLRGAVVAGQWWRLLTSVFLHGGAMHLLGNTFALLYIGMYLEPLLGKFRYISAYVLTGVCAGLLSIVMHPASVGVGASGAIFGMYGVFLSMLTTSHIKKTLRTTMLRSMLFFVVYNLMMGLQGNTDNAAHIGGLISGFIIGYIFYPGVAKHHTVKKQLLTTAAIALCVAFITTGIVYYFK